MCQHGPVECRLNRIINCATHLHPGQDMWLPFVECLEGAPHEQSEAWVDKCAGQTGLDAQALHGCAEGEQGAELEHEAEAETASLTPPHRYVPWVVVNGIPLGQDNAQLWRYVCVAHAGNRPDACYVPPGASLAGQRPERSTA